MAAMLLMIDWPAGYAATAGLEEELRALGAQPLSEDVYLIADAAGDRAAIDRLRARVARCGGLMRIGCVRDIDGS